jgi:hypothetical protein
MSKNIKKVVRAVKRIALSNEAMEILEKEIERVKLKESKLASAIIELFCSKYLEKERGKIEEIFIDKKSYLKTLIEQSMSEDELAKTLNDFINKTKMRKAKAQHDE